MSWAIVQSAFSTTGTGTGALSGTYSSNVSSGTKLIAVIGHDGGSIPTMSVADGSSNAMTLITRVNEGASSRASVSLWAMDTPAGDVGTKPTITCTFGGNTPDASILIQEVSGLLAGNTTAMVDGTAGTSTGNLGGNTTSPTYSSTAANEYLVTCFSDNAFTDAITDPSSPWTSDANNPFGGGVVHTHLSYKNSTNGAETGAVFNYSNAGASYAQLMVAFKLGAPAGPTIQASPSSQSIPQGGSGTVAVNLSEAPGSDVTVDTSFTSGNTGLSVTGGGSLTFTPVNWATPQNVTITADGTSTGAASFSSTATGCTPASFTANETLAPRPVRAGLLGVLTYV